MLVGNQKYSWLDSPSCSLLISTPKILSSSLVFFTLHLQSKATNNVDDGLQWWGRAEYAWFIQWQEASASDSKTSYFYQRHCNYHVFLFKPHPWDWSFWTESPSGYAFSSLFFTPIICVFLCFLAYLGVVSILMHWLHYLILLHVASTMTEQSNIREFNTTPVIVSSRWNPTPEQLRTLEELYRRGTRTPSAEQIQHITAQLRRYGKIEGKNVFYWFQNHKARERQKRRRQLEPDEQNRDVESTERKESGKSRKK